MWIPRLVKQIIAGVRVELTTVHKEIAEQKDDARELAKESLHKSTTRAFIE
jgi:hypothetical protein